MLIEDCKPLYFCGWEGMNRLLYHVKPKVIFDCGTNRGDFVGGWLDLGAVVHCFEPVPDMMEGLLAKYGRNPRVVFNQVAVSDVLSFIPNITVHRCWMLMPAGCGQDVALDYNGKPPFDMTTITLDGYCKTMGVVPDFIKIDVDGYEPQLLRGAHGILSTHRIPMLLEYGFLPELLGESVPDMVRSIYEMGYVGVSMDGSYHSPTAEDMLAHYPHDTNYDLLVVPKEMIPLTQ